MHSPSDRPPANPGGPRGSLADLVQLIGIEQAAALLGGARLAGDAATDAPGDDAPSHHLAARADRSDR